MSVDLSSANGTETPIAAADNFYEDTIRLVKFCFRVFRFFNCRFNMARKSGREDPSGRKLFGTLAECVKCFHTVELNC